MANSKREAELELQRLRAMQQETTDPMAARLIGDIVSEMEEAVQARAARTNPGERESS